MSTESPAPRPPGRRFPRSAPGAVGYDVAEVDAFLSEVEAALGGARPAGTGSRVVTSAQVRAAVFSGARGGYRAEAVDEALEAAEDALAAAEHEQVLRTGGPAAWRRHVEGLEELVRGRLARPRTQRFRHPSRTRARGYSVAHVDVLCERLTERLDDGAALDAAELRHAVFPSAQGELGYEEHQVDAFLDRAVELLLALR
ncbi:DivIVA domain-containing protein [Kocuria sp. M1R5S2]|uniref:DivIVA domain-containing protein n=1 Tax=Kocuria rhizosphaerae TaxID=3376285 RepID=UPI00379AC73A